MSWLDELKVGDEVLRCTGDAFFRQKEIVAVERVTKTQVILAGDVRYSKDGGRRVGGPRGDLLVELTDEGRIEARKLELVGRFNGEFYKRDHWNALRLDQLEGFAVLLDSPAPGPADVAKEIKE